MPRSRRPSSYDDPNARRFRLSWASNCKDPKSETAEIIYDHGMPYSIRKWWDFHRPAIMKALQLTLAHGVVSFDSPTETGQFRVDLIKYTYDQLKDHWQTDPKPQLMMRTMKWLDAKFTHALSKWCKDSPSEFERMVREQCAVYLAEDPPRPFVFDSARKLSISKSKNLRTRASPPDEITTGVAPLALQVQVHWFVTASDPEPFSSHLVQLPERPSRNELAEAIKGAAACHNTYRTHDILICAYIPSIGPWLSALLGDVQVQQYYREARDANLAIIPDLIVLPFALIPRGSLFRLSEDAWSLAFESYEPLGSRAS